MSEFQIVIIFYFLNVMSVVTMLYIWFDSMFGTHFINSFIKPKQKLYTEDDFQNYLMENFGDKGFRDFKLDELLLCPVCFGTWSSIILSMISSIVLAVILSPVWAVLLFPFILTTPGVSQVIYNLRK